MKIVILGAGVTGSSVAGALASEENDIVVIDKKPHLLSALKGRLDIATIEGNAAHPTTLEQAGVGSADMVIAVTDRDETNMLACQVINTLYERPKTIARVRAIDFLNHPELFRPGGIDIVISPEQVVTEAIHNLIKYPGALHVSEFADGLVRLFSIRVAPSGFLTGKKIQAVKEKLADNMIRIAAIFRDGKAIPVNGSAVIGTGDEVFFVCPRDKVRKTLVDLHKLESPIKTIMLAGGGHVGKRLAMALENKFQVKVIEMDVVRAREIANDLRNTMILHGDCTDEALLLEEMIEDVDLFCAITNNDGINLISAGLAKKLGAKKAICLINNNSYLKLLDGTDIDLAGRPQHPQPQRHRYRPGHSTETGNFRRHLKTCQKRRRGWSQFGVRRQRRSDRGHRSSQQACILSRRPTGRPNQPTRRRDFRRVDPRRRSHSGTSRYGLCRRRSCRDVCIG